MKEETELDRPTLRLYRHGAEEPWNEEERKMTAIDPVCGMTVDETDAPAKLEHDGTTYYFCSTDCKEEFETNPEDYSS